MCRKMLKKLFIFFILFIIYPFFHAGAQSNIVPDTKENYEFPQWAKDLRRWEIVAFGSFPFTMFTSTFAMDMYRWHNYNGMKNSDGGMRYAPWPLKSAGAVDMTKKEYENTMIIAAGLSVAIAVTDLIIVQVKRQKARQRAESLPVTTTIINRQPWPPVSEQDDLINETLRDENNIDTADIPLSLEETQP